MTTPQTASPSRRLDGGALAVDMRETLRLGTPVMFARAGILAMFVVDSVMVGQVGADELGFLSLGLTMQMLLMLVSVGILQGAMVMTAQAIGAREEARVGAVWRVSLLHAFALGTVFALVSLLTGPFLRLTGQSEPAIAGAVAVAHQFAWGMPGMLLYIACGYLLEGIGRAHVGMFVLLGANLLNVALNAVFVWGWLGIVPAMGADGAVLATSLIRWLMFASALVYIAVRIDWRRYGLSLDLRLALRPEGLEAGRRMRRLGLPMGLAQAVESGAFQSIVLMAGRLGPAALAAHHVTMTYIQIIYMVAVGLAAATSIRVGRAVGRGDLAAVRLAGWAGLALVALIMLAPALVFALAPQGAAAFFVGDPAVLAIARVTLLVTSLLVVFDGLMGVAMGALRGTGDVWVPLALHGAVFWLIAVPFAFALSFGLGLGAAGLTFGLLAGVALSSLVLALRFYAVTRRAIAPA